MGYDSSPNFVAMMGAEASWEESESRALCVASWSQPVLLTIARCLGTKVSEAILRNVNRFFEAIDHFDMEPLKER